MGQVSYRPSLCASALSLWPVFAFLLQGCQDGSGRAAKANPRLPQVRMAFPIFLGTAAPSTNELTLHKRRDWYLQYPLNLASGRRKEHCNFPGSWHKQREGKVFKHLQCCVYEEELFCYYSCGGIITWVSVEMQRRKEIKETLCLHPLPT